jgi:septum formation protein
MEKPQLPLILASGSPRRRELLAAAGLDVEVVPPPAEAEGDGPDIGDPAATVLAAAERKASSVAGLRHNALVLGADTVVALDRHILGKPASPDEARLMLRRLAGRRHEVYTGMVAAAWADGVVLLLARAVAVSEVEFRPLSDEEIDAYVESGEPMDKAGAYGIQGGAAGFVAGLTGPWDNVVGLPVDRALELVAEAERLLASAREAGGR